MVKGVKQIAFLAIAAVVAGCAAMPVAGPLADDIVHHAGDDASTTVNYVVIDVTSAVCRALAEHTTHPIEDVFGDGAAPPANVLGIGDTLNVSIWEGSNGGLFTSMPPTATSAVPRGITLPPVVIAQDGKISIPFAGRLMVAGKTAAQIEQIIRANLVGVTDNPQVVVSVAQSQANVISVGGEVTRAARVPLDIGGARILDVLAGAGGVRIPVNESVIRLTRGNRTASVSYSAVLSHPEDNVYLRPGDTLTVERAPKTFTTFGALGRSYLLPFESDTVSVEEALARAGGLLDQRSDPSGVFVFRYEPKDLVNELAPGASMPQAATNIPVVFHIDLSGAAGYFLARQFAVRDKDIVYAANAEMNELQKFLNLLGSVVAPAATTAAISTTIR